MSMMWRSSKTGEAPPSRDGIGIGPPLSGEASDTHAVTGPMRAVIGREAQELPPSMCCRDAFAPCAITDGSAMPLQMATDPLGTDKASISSKIFTYFAAHDTLRVRRVALDGIPRSNREELRRRFLEHPANLKLKGRGEKSLLWKAVMSRRCVCSCTASSARYGQS